jgi:putative copper resistance protein D
MDWLAAADSLIVVRGIHFAATAVLAGTLVFRTLVAKPALPPEHAVAKKLRVQNLRVVWIALAVTALSGVIWLLLQAVSMSGLTPAEAMTPQVLSTVLNETQFGEVTEYRSALAIILAACLAFDRSPLANWLALATALGLMAAIAWTGHAGSTPGELGNLHLAADALHLVAAASWVGGLVPLVLLLSAVRRDDDLAASASPAGRATRRFSILGIVSRDARDDGPRQQLDSGRFVPRAAGHRIRANPVAQACRFRIHAGVGRREPILPDATACGRLGEGMPGRSPAFA